MDDARAMQKVLRVDGLDLRVVDSGISGAAPPLLFIHSLGGNLDHWAASLMHFASRRRVLALDLPGHGQSDKPVDFDYSVAAFARTVTRLLDEHGIERAIWIGNSLGGHVALYQAVHASSRVAGLVLANATGANIDFDIERLLSNPRAVLAKDGSSAGDHRSLLPLLFSDPRGPAARHVLIRQLEDLQQADFPARMRAVLLSARSIAETPLLSRLADVTAPTLVVWGEDDRLLARGNATALAQIRGAHLAWLPRSGHLSVIETPEAFHRELEVFLQTS
jgi:pyruvate dehydrogenase E2 component (dihydrolipoamide acetyltransferase)